MSVHGADGAVTWARLQAEYSAGDGDFWLWLPRSDAEWCQPRVLLLLLDPCSQLVALVLLDSLGPLVCRVAMPRKQRWCCIRKDELVPLPHYWTYILICNRLHNWFPLPAVTPRIPPPCSSSHLEGPFQLPPEALPDLKTSQTADSSTPAPYCHGTQRVKLFASVWGQTPRKGVNWCNSADLIWPPTSVSSESGICKRLLMYYSF